MWLAGSFHPWLEGSYLRQKAPTDGFVRVVKRRRPERTSASAQRTAKRGGVSPPAGTEHEQPPSSLESVSSPAVPLLPPLPLVAAAPSPPPAPLTVVQAGGG